MSIAWTPVVVILFLLPAVAFFTGLWGRERQARQVLRANVISELGLAIAVAIFLHGLAWFVLWLPPIHFDLAAYITPFWDGVLPGSYLLVDYLRGLWWYVVLTTAGSFCLGLFFSNSIVSGALRFLATHKLAYEILKRHKDGGGVLTVYVMTNIVENKRVLMYRGQFDDFYLDQNGNFSYLVLANCKRFFMNMGAKIPRTTKQTPLFADKNRPAGQWNYLVISSEQIANVLFDREPYNITDTGVEKLTTELAKRGK